jgi:hypothetical protein
VQARNVEIDTWRLCLLIMSTSHPGSTYLGESMFLPSQHLFLVSTSPHNSLQAHLRRKRNRRPNPPSTLLFR